LNLQQIKIALEIAWKLYGTPYRWGGDDPMQGFDCSGLCVEILKSVGRVPRNNDYTANGLFKLFHEKEVKEPTSGCLVFWGNAKKLTHVEFCINEDFTIGASGGGSKTITTEDAINQNAFIKVRPIRSGYLKIVDPFK